MKKFLLVFFCMAALLSYSQEEEITDRLEGLLPTNYISVEAAFTPGLSFSSGVDAYFDVFRIFKKESAPSWIITGQYYFYTMPAHEEKIDYKFGHNFGLRGGGFKIGTGIILFEKVSTMRFRFYYDSSSGMEEGNKLTKRIYDGPIAKSYGIFVNYIEENSGNGWILDTVNSDGTSSYRALHGYNAYIVPSLKIQKAWNFLKKGINPDGQKGWRYFDIGIPFTPDFKQFGVRLEWFMLTGIWTSRLSVGAIYRNDSSVPSDPDTYRNQLLHWYFPITLTLGIGGNWLLPSNGDRRYNEKLFGKGKSLL